MTGIAQPANTARNPFLGVALAISLLGGIVGGAVAIGVPAVINAQHASDAAKAAELAKWQKYGQEWEARYRQMYPSVD
jgi:hypothetical protein